jgi:16S rRNA (uracil1498-N3)-methyltransferase
VAAVGKREVELAVLSKTAADRELSRHVTLCAALPRGDRQRWLVEKAVELGVTRFVPLPTRRGVVEPDDGVCERLRRTVVEASKQCGRNRLMEIASPGTMPPAAESFPADTLKLLAHPGGGVTLAQLMEELRGSPSRPIAFCVGPEGGFTDDEAAAAIAVGWRAVDLGPRILRIETAATMLAAWAATISPTDAS